MEESTEREHLPNITIIDKLAFILLGNISWLFASILYSSIYIILNYQKIYDPEVKQSVIFYITLFVEVGTLLSFIIYSFMGQKKLFNPIFVHAIIGVTITITPLLYYFKVQYHIYTLPIGIVILAFCAGCIGCFFNLIFYRWVTKFRHECLIYLNIGISLSGVVMFPINMALYSEYISLLGYYFIALLFSVLGILSYFYINKQGRLLTPVYNDMIPLTYESIALRMNAHCKQQVLACIYQTYISFGYFFALSTVLKAYENVTKYNSAGVSYLFALNTVL